MRQGRQAYPALYEKAVLLAGQGIAIKDIARQLGVSYSACYHWVNGLRKPDEGNLNSFVDEIKQNGPLPAASMNKFPKHNELFLTASRRGMGIKRYMLPKKLGDYSTWYFVSGQEDKLKEGVLELVKKYKELKQELLERLLEFG
ncbi:MAG: helix-turn-helix domain-containing protein [Candidatus Aenigmarchaeota archaeon]|nr:helix-turn-helix domain-containing protein [Candidatus Aenigmarchaeota archaeon]